MRLVIDGDVVDVGHARLYLQGKGHAALMIARDHGTRQAVFGVVGQCQSVGFVACFDHRQDRAKAFFFCQCRLWIDINEHMRWQYLVGDFTTQYKFRAILLGLSDDFFQAA